MNCHRTKLKREPEITWISSAKQITMVHQSCGGGVVRQFWNSASRFATTPCIVHRKWGDSKGYCKDHIVWQSDSDFCSTLDHIQIQMVSHGQALNLAIFKHGKLQIPERSFLLTIAIWFSSKPDLNTGGYLTWSTDIAWWIRSYSRTWS